MPCDKDGNFLPPDSPPPPWESRAQDDFSPFQSLESFLLADLLFRRNKMPQQQINDLMECWARSLPPDSDPPFANADDLYATIDSSDLGHVPWQSFSVSYQASKDEELNASWKLKEYDVWFCDPRKMLKIQLSNQDFAKAMDFAAKQVLDPKTGIRRFQDFMSGEWAWEQSVSNISTFSFSR